jgi:hypothetical protein
MVAIRPTDLVASWKRQAIDPRSRSRVHLQATTGYVPQLNLDRHLSTDPPLPPQQP